MAAERIEKVNSLLKEVISEVISNDLKSHDLPRLLTITDVDTSKDLRNAKVYISVINANEEEKNKILVILQNYSGKIGVLAAKKITLKYFPKLTFLLDESIDYYMKIDSLLEKINIESN